MALDGDEVEDDDDRDMLLLSLLLCWNASLQRGPCDLPLVWVHVRVVESLWLQWPVAAGCGKPVAALGATYQSLSDGALQQLTGHEKRTTADRHVLRDATMHRHTARAQRVQIAPYASFVATTLATIDAVLVDSHGRVPTCRCRRC